MVNVYEHPNISRGMKEPITLDGMKVFGPYTPGVKAGNQFWLSGQISIEQGIFDCQQVHIILGEYCQCYHEIKRNIYRNINRNGNKF